MPKEQTQKVAAHILPLADNSSAIGYLFSLGQKSTTLVLHSERVAILAGIIAKWMKLGWEEIRTVVTAAFLHDVGKIKFPDDLLDKAPGTLEGEERKLYQKHCETGAELLKDAGFDEAIQSVVLCHHERMNSSGFPSGLSGAAIPPHARIVAVADTYDNLTSKGKGADNNTPFQAIRYFVRETYFGLDPVVCVPLLTRIKDSMIGSRVVLSDNRKGVVAMYPNYFSSRPVIALDDGGNVDLNKFPLIDVIGYSG